MTALAFAGIAMFAIALVVVAIGMARQAVRYVRDVRGMIRASTEPSLLDKPLKDLLSHSSGAQPNADPPPPEPDDDLPPGWGFR